MLAKYFSIIRNYVLSVSSQRKYNFHHQNMLLGAFQTNSRNITGRNPSMVIPLLANQDLTLMLSRAWLQLSHTHSKKLHLEPPLLKFLTITPDYYNYIVFTKNYQLDLCNKT